ncbi:hypothetical protein COTS27_01110 [Spirochaetota bacterium]|nr:hypothetical protein COTS27_01110 [Spirochaetota bacterium]
MSSSPIKIFCISLIILILGIVMTSCAKLKEVPVITNLDLNKVYMIDNNVTAEVLLTINNPSSYDITVRLTHLQISRNSEPLLTELPKVPTTTIKKGNNQITLPITVNKDKLINNAFKSFITSQTTFTIKGSFIYQYATVKGKFYFNEPITVDLSKVLDTTLDNVLDNLFK